MRALAASLAQGAAAGSARIASSVARHRATRIAGSSSFSTRSARVTLPRVLPQKWMMRSSYGQMYACSHIVVVSAACSAPLSMPHTALFHVQLNPKMRSDPAGLVALRIVKMVWSPRCSGMYESLLKEEYGATSQSKSLKKLANVALCRKAHRSRTTRRVR